jgi:putative transposase
MGLRVYRYRLVMTPAQAAAAARFAGCARFVWNLGLEHRITAFRIAGKRVTYQEQCRELTILRGEIDWLAQAPTHVLQQALRDLDRAFERFFDGTAGFPRFKKRGSHQSMRFPDPKQFEVRRVSKKWAMARFPKLGWCRVRWTRELDGEIRHASVKCEADRWHVSFCIETPAQTRVPNGLAPVGVDVGVVTAIATSDGSRWDFNGWRPGEAERLRRLEMKLSRQVRGSRNREKTRRAIQRIYLRARNRRANFAHVVSTHLAREHGLIAVENLSVTAMTRSARGTRDAPGRRVAQKSGLNRAVLDKGWGMLLGHLAYKCPD